MRSCETVLRPLGPDEGSKTWPSGPGYPALEIGADENAVSMTVKFREMTDGTFEKMLEAGSTSIAS